MSTTAGSVQCRNTRKRLRWYQFRLRTLFLFLLITSLGLSWLAVILKRGNDQLQAVKAIEASGGWVCYDCGIRGESPPGPAWLRSLLGDRFFATVVSASIEGDARLEQVNGLRGLEDLSWVADPVGHFDLVHITTLTNLRRLELWNPRLTDCDLAPLQQLAGHTKLHTLSLVDCKLVTDAGIENLRPLVQLQTVMIESLPVTGNCLRSFAGMTQLRQLYLITPTITDDGLENLAALTSLEHLDLSCTRVTDRGLKHLHALENLKTLVLDQTLVTDAGMSHLKALTRLEELDLRWTRVTIAGLKQLHCLTHLRQLLVSSGMTAGTIKDITELDACFPKGVIKRGP